MDKGAFHSVSAPGPELLEVNNLVTEYSLGRRLVRAVDNVSLKLTKARTLGIAGESGCGKTTLGLSIAQLLPTNAAVRSGSVTFEGMNLTAMTREEIRQSVRWKRISMIFQGSMSAFNPVVRVGDFIVDTIRLHDPSATKQSGVERAAKLFSSVGLQESRLGSFPHELSGGMRQRAMIALALACSPSLVIADEPTTALDVIVQAQIVQLLRKLSKETEASMIFISHDLSVVAQVSDECAIMYAGKIVELGLTSQVFHNPLHPYTMKLLSSFPDVRAENRVTVTGIEGTPPSLSNLPSGCRFNPRCSYAKSVCQSQDPQMIEFEKGHYVSCFWRQER